MLEPDVIERIPPHLPTGSASRQHPVGFTSLAGRGEDEGGHSRAGEVV